MMDVLEMAVMVLTGLVLGSFATALTYREQRGLSWTGVQRSVCTSCKATLGVRDLVPVFSWLFLKGKCRKCRAPISIRYPLTELGVLIACVVVYGFNDFSPETFFICAAIPFLAALLLIDLEQMILPNRLVLIVGMIGAGRLVFHSVMAGLGAGLHHIFLPYILGAVVYGGLAWLLGWVTTKILKRDALGFGDVKFFAVAGLWLGISNLGLFCVLSGVLGVIFALIWRLVTKERHFPFGPALIAAFYLLLLL
jgi:leader peptidase (prepilin peptidase)/N-methyltransferase